MLDCLTTKKDEEGVEEGDVKTVGALENRNKEDMERKGEENKRATVCEQWEEVEKINSTCHSVPLLLLGVAHRTFETKVFLEEEKSK